MGFSHPNGKDSTPSYCSSYFNAITFASTSVEWITKSRFNKYVKSGMEKGASPIFQRYSSMIAQGHFTLEEYRAYIVDRVSQKLTKEITTEPIDGNFIKRNHELWYSQARIDKDKKMFKLLHDKLKRQLSISTPSDYLKYVEREGIGSHSYLFHLLNNKMISPIFYLGFMESVGMKEPNLIGSGNAKEEEYYRKAIRLLTFTS